MNEHEEHLTTEETRARDAVRAFPRPTASAAFRERLRQEFVSGAIADRPSILDDAVLEPVATEDAEAAAMSGGATVLAIPWFRRPAIAWMTVPAAAAALIMVALLLNRGPAWEIAVATGDGVAIVDGRSIPMNHMDELARAIRSGARVVLPADAELQLKSPGNMAISLTSSAAFTVPESPGRWWGRGVRAKLDKGTLRVVASPSFANGLLTVSTPEMIVEVANTTLAIECFDIGTCVCVLDGDAGVAAEHVQAVAVGSGKRRVIFNDGRAPLDDAMLDSERMALIAMAETFGTI
jgi:hypothetical protein